MNEDSRELRVDMKLNLSQIAKCVGLLVLTFTSLSQGQEATDSPLVEVRIPRDDLGSYKQRREDHGGYVSVSYEPLTLKKYISTLDNKIYGDLFGADGVPMLGLSIDYKYNLGIGSVSMGVDYAQGSLSDSRSGGERNLHVTKYGASAKILADMITDEPYVVPYLGLGIWQMNISEDSATDSFSAPTGMGMSYSAGILLQLDWIDKDTAQKSTAAWGMENTFLDLYISQYTKTDAADDPNTETDPMYGAGLRVEF